MYKDTEQLAYPKDATITDVLLYSNLNGTPPDKPAIIDGITDEVIFTYASFRTSVRKIARHLRHELGIGPDMVVGILSTNTVGCTEIISALSLHNCEVRWLIRLKQNRTTTLSVCTLS